MQQLVEDRFFGFAEGWNAAEPHDGRLFAFAVVEAHGGFRRGGHFKAHAFGWLGRELRRLLQQRLDAVSFKIGRALDGAIKK